MPTVEDRVSVRGHGDAPRIDVDIEADDYDGELALEWVEQIRDAVKARVDELEADDE